MPDTPDDKKRSTVRGSEDDLEIMDFKNETPVPGFSSFVHGHEDCDRRVQEARADAEKWRRRAFFAAAFCLALEVSFVLVLWFFVPVRK